MSNITLSNSEFELIRDLLEEKCGIFFSNDKTYLLEAKLAPLVFKYKLSSYWELFETIRKSEHTGILREVVNELTITETFWFRDDYPFAILKEHVLPEITKWRNSTNPINILSIGSSTGQEPYSIAITINQYCESQKHISKELFTINAYDINSDAIKFAKNGLYSIPQIDRGINEQQLQQYFDKRDEGWELNKSIKKMVTFSQKNILDGFPQDTQYDVVFVRNILIYFIEAKRNKCLDNILCQIKKGGFLVLGSMENYSIEKIGFKKIRFNRGNAFQKQ